ncbi:hypothetical protein BJY24_002927 [Nocardia transvalensis]|uniref:DUF4822 domain-containing protein n=1 Tax=Nocardia transvalensis TaxID=37333 RepID=A0A7W9PDK0_9NOCA|nr:DUF4822 domain-containing protein [Nocardia transvalensis]MBB5914060.1 hypothetical protein [Nocardia transvalensis]
MKTLASALAALAAVGALAACSSSNDSDDSTSTPAAATSVATGSTLVAPRSPSATLAATPWETTSARDAQGGTVALTDDHVKNYVGFAYFKPDGTFTMVNLDDSPKMHGDWSVPADGKTRTIIAKNDAGQEQSRRTVDIVTLTDKEFTYRVYPTADDKTVYYDIVHTPTTHAEPAK